MNNSQFPILWKFQSAEFWIPGNTIHVRATVEQNVETSELIASCSFQMETD